MKKEDREKSQIKREVDEKEGRTKRVKKSEICFIRYKK